MGISRVPRRVAFPRQLKWPARADDCQVMRRQLAARQRGEIGTIHQALDMIAGPLPDLELAIRADGEGREMAAVLPAADAAELAPDLLAGLLYIHLQLFILILYQPGDR